MAIRNAQFNKINPPQKFETGAVNDESSGTNTKRTKIVDVDAPKARRLIAEKPPTADIEEENTPL